MAHRTGVLCLCVIPLAACASPEATRTRGGGAGADLHDRQTEIRMHEGSAPFWETPIVIEEQYPALESAHQARELSLK
jgi:hypothetical protein